MGVLQGVVGYVQYFNDIPAGLVAVHIAGATAFMIVLTALWWNLSESSTGSAHTVDDRRVTVSS